MGSHRHFCMLGDIGLDNRQKIFREYNRFNEIIFYEFLKQLHYKFPKCYLFLDKASPFFNIYAPYYRIYISQNLQTVHISTVWRPVTVLLCIWVWLDSSIKIEKWGLVITPTLVTFEDISWFLYESVHSVINTINDSYDAYTESRDLWKGGTTSNISKHP